jgi:hypothetical protein
MKLNKLFTTFIIISLVSGSCSEDRLIEMPVYDDVIENAITNETDMKSVLNGIYNEYSSASAFGANILIFGDLISDNVFITNRQTDVAFRNTGSLNWSQEINDFSMIRSIYGGIVLANTVINDTHLAQSTNVDNMKGEAMIARAVGYYFAVGFYSPSPALGINQEYGVPLNLGNYDSHIVPPRASVSEVYNQIIKDLTEGISLMTNEIPEDKGYLSPTAAKLLLSRVYLTRGAAGDYQKALNYADEVINSSSSIGNGNVFNFVPNNATDYVNYFSSKTASDNQPETVWEIDMGPQPSENPGVNSAISTFYASDGSKKRFLFTQEFYNLFSTNDIRKGLFTSVGVPTEDNPKGLWTRKYTKLMSDGNFTQNVKIFRMSEAYLNKIEALYKLGSANTLTELNDFAVNKRKGTAYSSATLENILTERRKEFFAEGQRYFDLKRNNLGFTKNTNCYSVVCDVPADSKLFVIPISNTEMLINPNIKQYPGW